MTPGQRSRSPRSGASSVPGPLRFVGRAVATLWLNGKARIGLVILGLFIVIAIFAPLIAPHSPTSTDFTPV